MISTRTKAEYGFEAMPNSLMAEYRGTDLFRNLLPPGYILFTRQALIHVSIQSQVLGRIRWLAQ
jgi:hypothetical protein